MRLPSPDAALACKSRQAVLLQLTQAEQADGWLSACEDAGQYLVLCHELIDVLARELGTLTRGPVLEVAAGEGLLAEALRQRQINVIATDIAPPKHAQEVTCIPADKALKKWMPQVVLGSFVPFDAGIDQAVLEDLNVRYYIVLNARIGGQLGDDLLWHHPLWHKTPLFKVTTEMVTRHDIWMGNHRPIRPLGEAWLFKRILKENLLLRSERSARTGDQNCSSCWGLPR